MRSCLAGAFSLALLLFVPAVARAAASLKVTSAAVCDAREEECTAVEQSFGEEVASLKFVTVVEGATGEAWVEHVWLREGRELFRRRLPLKGNRYRTVTVKTVAGLPGAWTVVVLDPVRRELAKVSFRVEGPEPAP